MNKAPWILLVLSLWLIKIITAAFVGLSDDEAYYWYWSLVPEFNYFEHPPMVAWLIAGSCKLFGSSEFAIRLPSLLSHVFAQFFIFQMSFALQRKISYAQKSINSWKLLALLNLSILYGPGALLVSPDAPLIFFWSMFLYLLVFFSPLVGPWLVFAGLVLGLGFLSKYTIVFLIIGWFFAAQYQRDTFLKSWWMFACLALIAGSFIPAIYWNSLHDWAGFKYHLLERHGGASLNPLRWLGFVVLQFLLLGPLLFSAFLEKVTESIFLLQNKRLGKNSSQDFLILLSLPGLLFFWFQPFLSDFKPNWTLPLYVALLPLFVYSLEKSRPYHYWLPGILQLLVFAFIYYPFISRFQEPKNDISSDLFGWEVAAEEVKSQLEDIRKNGTEVFVAGAHYQVSSPLQYYLFRSLSSERVWNFGRMSHFYFRQSKEDLAGLTGMDALIVTNDHYSSAPTEVMGFDFCLPPKVVPTERLGVKTRNFYVWHCRHFLGPIL